MYIVRNILVGLIAGVLVFFAFNHKGCERGDSEYYSARILGKWVATKVEGKHVFNDESESLGSTMPKEGDYIEFTQEEDGNTGKFTTVQYGMKESGTWEFSSEERIITITYTSFEPNFILFRRVESVSDSALVLTIDGELIKKWVKVNHILEDSPKKIVGGYLMEQYVKMN